MPVAFGVKSWHVNLLYFVKPLNSFEQHRPSFHQRCLLEKGLLFLSTCLAAESLPKANKDRSVFDSHIDDRYTHCKFWMSIPNRRKALALMSCSALMPASAFSFSSSAIASRT